MSKKNVYLFQLTQGGFKDNAAKKSDLNKDELYFFPYSIALIQSYSQQITELNQSYDFKKIVNIWIIVFSTNFSINNIYSLDLFQ